MIYDKEFEEWFAGYVEKEPYAGNIKPTMYLAWLASNKDHYRIGEEVEAKQIGAQWKKGTVVAGVYSNNNYYIEEPERVRRIPPKSRIDEIADEKLAIAVKALEKIRDVDIQHNKIARDALKEIQE